MRTVWMDATYELQALWNAVFGEPPFVRADAKLMAEVLVGALPPAPPYEPTAANPSAAVRREAEGPAFTSAPEEAMGLGCAS